MDRKWFDTLKFSNNIDRSDSSFTNSSVVDRFPRVANRMRLLRASRSRVVDIEKPKEQTQEGTKTFKKRRPVVEKITDPVTYFKRKLNNEELDMSQWRLDLSQTVEISKVFPTMNTSVLVLTGCHLGDDGGKTVAEGLMKNCTVSELNLSENNLGSSAIQAVAELLLENETLKSLSLSNNGLSDSDVIPAVQSLQRKSCLKKLNLSRNILMDDFAEQMNLALQNNTCIEKLYLSNNFLGHSGLSIMFSGLTRTRTLKFLDISWNYMYNAGAVLLGQLIRANISLLEILACGNFITAEGAFCVAQSLQANATLQVLKIGQNLIQSEGIVQFAVVLMQCPESALLCLDLNGVIAEKSFCTLLGEVANILPNLKIVNFTVAIEEETVDSEEEKNIINV